MKTDTVKSDDVMRSRAIEQLVVGHATSDGAGVKLTRVLGQALQQRLDPFLMLDAFGSDKSNDYIAGFPNHPHRGFETLTYLINGRMRHSDNAGHQGLLETGGIQWMTAGRGIIHSEMPEQKDGLLEGFQLWINLPAAQKMQPAGYQDVQSEQIPELLTANGVKVRVIVGSSHGVVGAIQRPDTEPLFLDVHLPAGASFSQSLPAGHNVFFYVYRGEVAVAERTVSNQRMAILSNSAVADGLILQAKQDSRLILVAGKPLRETIVQHGPFVMNNREQIEQAIDDYQRGRFAAVI
ncbi:pirin family protein [Methylomonas albis]|uniref:Pirin family protein n=1 Tax=Methylomonas albis TaxID=1854563 RepID=A0ABR9CY84_9GAMM|nr:pirin family protein [Methylomonas albis]MBD9354953.1 pirin family protein [Methylomonas albis]